MTKEEYKKQMIEKLYKFLDAYNELQEMFNNDEFNCNDYICDDYPFDKSYDELAISDWVYTVEDNLNKKLS